MAPHGPGSDLSDKAKILIEAFNRGGISREMGKTIIKTLIEKEGISAAQIREHLISGTNLRTEFEHNDHQFSEFMERRWEHEREEETHHQREHDRGLKAVRNLAVIAVLGFIVFFSLYFFDAIISSDSPKTSEIIEIIEETQNSSNDI